MLSGVDELKDWMRRRGFTQADAARYLGWTEPYLSKVMTGTFGLGLKNAVALERLTGIPVEAWASTEIGEAETPVAAATAKRRIAK